MRVLGIDPGLGITGYGIIEQEDRRIRVIEAGVIRTDDRQSLALRLSEIATELREIIKESNPDAIAVEELYSHYSHPRTAIVMGHARGIVFLKAGEAGISVFPYASTKVKKALTGNGRASKVQMQRMIMSTLGLPKLPEPPDAADALAIALCHCHQSNMEEVAA